MINRFIKFFSSMKFVVLLLLLFAFSIGYATFIENDFGTDSAKALIYNTWWFELLLIILGISLILNMIKHKVFRKEKLAILGFHLSFIVILIGAAITRYTGYEGSMSIVENTSNNRFLSSDIFLHINVHDNKHEYKSGRWYFEKLNLSGITKRFDHTPILQNLFSNYFSISNSDLKEVKQDFSISYSDFLPNAISGITIRDRGDSEKQGTSVNVSEMANQNILIGEEIVIKKINFTVNNIQDSSVNFIISDGKVECIADFEISVKSMPPVAGEPTDIYKKDSLFLLNRNSLLTINSKKYLFDYLLFSEVSRKEQMLLMRSEGKVLSMSNNMDYNNKEDRFLDALVLDIFSEGQSRKITLFGHKKSYPIYDTINLGDLTFTLAYGPRHYKTPFEVFLKDFKLETYAGSPNASSFASEVQVIDSDTTFPYRIYMNNTLNWKGYRFFQSSYKENIDGRGTDMTVLSVNHDWWGTLITYIGYTLMMLSMILVFFFKNTRFNSLSKKLNKLKKSTLILFFSLFSVVGFSQVDDNYLDSIEKYKINENHSDDFERLLIQHNGRIKPMSTYASEIIRKISRKESVYNQSPSQVLLGIICFPEIWKHIPLVKVQNKQLLKELNSTNDLVSYQSFSENGVYLFHEKKDVSKRKPEEERSKYDKELIKVDERFNVLRTMLFTTRLNTLTIFPNPEDSITQYWERKKDIPHTIGDSIVFVNLLNYYFSFVKSSFFDNNWGPAESVLNIIQKYQIDNGGDLIPPQWKVDLEIMYNKLNVFHKLFYFYFFSGLISLILLIFQMFYNNKWINKSIRIIKWIIISGIFIHTLGLIARWIISNHAPWTNGYEAMIYTVWATMLAGLIFSRKSDLTLSATTLVSSMLLLFTWISYLDPTITNVVPVLNSYWLMIHVSVIVSSYGFLIMGGFLGLLSLILMIFKSKKNKEIINLKISELTIINEKTLIIGLFMLSIGTFLGGIWASESWGRYWGWDAKETWALVSILVYAFILHMRFVPGLKGRYTFNFASVIGVYSVLMTYFGVNYLLSGLHSYAAGDKVSIPMSVWISVLIVIIIAILAKLNNNKK